MRVQKTIYIADDERSIREIITGFLNVHGFETRSFEDGASLLRAFEEKPCDLVVLDIMMDGMDGLALCAEIRRKSAVPVIFVSAKDSELDRVAGILQGGDDYLVKPFSPIELVARVQAIFRRIDLDTKGAKGSLLRYGNLALDADARRAEQDGAALDLTPLEFSLLAYLIENDGRAVSREELLKNVWKFDFSVDTRATDDLVKRLRKKLASGNVRIESVWGYGFKLGLKA